MTIPEHSTHKTKKASIKIRAFLILIVLNQIRYGFYVVYDYQPSGLFELIIAILLFCLFGSWFMEDSKKVTVHMF